MTTVLFTYIALGVIAMIIIIAELLNRRRQHRAAT